MLSDGDVELYETILCIFEIFHNEKSFKKFLFKA